MALGIDIVEPSLYDTVRKLEDLVGDLQRLIHGDQATRTGGLVAEFDALRAETKMHAGNIHDLRVDLERLRRRRPVIWLWLTAFLTFCCGVLLLVIAGVNAATPSNWMDAPPGLLLGLAVFFLILSAPLFLGGFGWFNDYQ